MYLVFQDPSIRTLDVTKDTNDTFLAVSRLSEWLGKSSSVRLGCFRIGGMRSVESASTVESLWTEESSGNQARAQPLSAGCFPTHHHKCANSGGRGRQGCSAGHFIVTHFYAYVFDAYLCVYIVLIFYIPCLYS